jgi:hypothetical protein
MLGLGAIGESAILGVGGVAVTWALKHYFNGGADFVA